MLSSFYFPFPLYFLFPLQIVEGSYPPIPKNLYSSQLSTVVSACLTKDPSERPDSVAVGALVAAILMKEVDQLKDHIELVKRRYDKEKEKSHKLVLRD